MRRQRFGPFRIDDTYMYFLSVSQSLTRPFSQSLSRFLSLSQFLFIRGTGGSWCSWGRLAGALKDGKTIDFERMSAAGRMMELLLMKLPVRHTVALLRKRDPSFVHKGPYQGTLSHCH
ncbi:unnamed protein product [Arctogadus glacialis]